MRGSGATDAKLENFPAENRKESTLLEEHSTTFATFTITQLFSLALYKTFFIGNIKIFSNFEHFTGIA